MLKTSPTYWSWQALWNQPCVCQPHPYPGRTRHGGHSAHTWPSFYKTHLSSCQGISCDTHYYNAQLPGRAQPSLWPLARLGKLYEVIISWPIWQWWVRLAWASFRNNKAWIVCMEQTSSARWTQTRAFLGYSDSFQMSIPRASSTLRGYLSLMTSEGCSISVIVNDLFSTHPCLHTSSFPLWHGD